MAVALERSVVVAALMTGRPLAACAELVGTTEPALRRYMERERIHREMPAPGVVILTSRPEGAEPPQDPLLHRIEELERTLRTVRVAGSPYERLTVTAVARRYRLRVTAIYQAIEARELVAERRQLRGGHGEGCWLITAADAERWYDRVRGRRNTEEPRT